MALFVVDNMEHVKMSKMMSFNNSRVEYRKIVYLALLRVVYLQNKYCYIASKTQKSYDWERKKEKKIKTADRVSYAGGTRANDFTPVIVKRF